MEKPILATNMDGFLLKHETFFEPHRIWFDRAILLTKDESLKNWKGKKDYFIGVNKAMDKIMPKASQEEKISQARRWYQEDVIYYIQTHPEVIINNIKESLLKIKNKFSLALVTTTSLEYTKKILKATNLENIYDIIYSTELSKEPNKEILFKSFVEKHGKPKYYVAGRNGEAWEEALSLGIITIYAAWDKIDEKFSQKAKTKIKDPEMLINLN